MEGLTQQRSACLPAQEGELARRYLNVLQQWVPVAGEYYADWPLRPNCGHFFSGCSWYGEETASSLFACALAASSPNYDPAITGYARETLQARALKSLRYLCFTHDTGPAECVRPERGLGRPEVCGTKWGERGMGFFYESQCGVTIAPLVITAMLLGDLVDAETWDMLGAICLDYAGRFGDMEPRNGVYVDTQMEENGWTSLGLATAELVLPGHARAAEWAHNVRRWMFLAATVPQDAKDQAPYVDGRTIAQHVFRTFTCLPDYMAENHGMVHPTYTAASLQFTGCLAALYGVFGRELPQQARFNRDRIYACLKAMTERMGYMHPVQGMDWPYLQPDPGTLIHATAAVVLGDADAACWERRALETLERRQRGNDGRMYSKELAATVHNIQDPMIIWETMVLGACYGYLLHRLYGDGPAATPTEELEARLRGVRVFPHSGFVFQRHEHGQTSFAWRNCIMALPLTSDGLYTVAPATGTLLGSLSVEGEPDCQRLHSLHVDQQRDGFAAALVMGRCQEAVRQEVLFAGLPNGAALSWERFVACRPLVAQRVTQGFLRVINEHFAAVAGNCDGYRLLHTPAETLRFESFLSSDPADDRLWRAEQLGWLNLDDRLGIVYRGSGATTYLNRHYFDPWWATADDLTLSACEGPIAAQAGDLLGELIVLLLPDQAHTATAAQQLWVLSSTVEYSYALLAEGHLVAANLADEPRRLVFSTTCPAEGAVPVFEGVTRLSGTTLSYELALPAGQAVLRPALLALVVQGQVEIVAAGTGQAFVCNTGTVPATVCGSPSRPELYLAPGETARL